MAKSRRLRLRDVRAVYLLVGECRELGADPVAWQTHFLGGMMRSVGSAVGVVVEADQKTYRGPRNDRLSPSSIVDHGWEKPGDRERFHRLIQDGAPVHNPILPKLTALAGSVRTFSRRDLLTDDEYYGNDFIADYIQQTNLDDFVGLFGRPAADFGLVIGLNRPRGDRRFGRRERRLLHLCSVEVVRLHGTRLAPGTAPSASRLAPRLRQVLLCLFDGDSEKQAAARLGIAPATVHEYVRRLHKAFEVSSRGELLARCAPLLPALRSRQPQPGGDGSDSPQRR